ncbi:secreted RxLR effector protein 161-like [Bidens hawaiensis]|uniref:secreted RxLR effector protein 161-like n=1 Tax=Bidens hawaiensis TaxID=980011 RepID=UPI00404AC4F9
MAYSVEIVSRYMQSPRESYGMTIRHLLRYLNKTTSCGIKYKKNGSERLLGYSDSSHNIDENDGRSTTGHMFYYGQSLITWCSQKQATVALDIAASTAACQVVWLRELLRELIAHPQ